MKTLQKGFTLIELMIVVAIIAILAAIAIPAYQDYMIRSQVTEGITLMDGAKTGVAEFFSNSGRMPGNNASAGLPAAPTSITGRYVASVTVASPTATAATITSVFNNTNANTAIRGKGVQMRGYSLAASETLTWNCQNQAGTTVATKYLPSSCRP